MSAGEFYSMVSGIGDSYRAGLDRYKKDQEDEAAKLALGQYFDAANNPQPQSLAALPQQMPASAPAQQGGLAAIGGNIGQAGKAISGIESGGNYNATGPVTKTGDRALGKYQIMSANLPQWSQEALGRPVTPQEFLANPQLQDAIFQKKFGEYTQKYGPEGAARAWFAGEGGMNDPNRKDQLGTSVASYGQRFAQAYGPGAQQQTQPPQQQPMPAPQMPPQQAMPGGAMAYSAAGQPVPTDAQGRALNPNGMPTGPGQVPPPAQQAIAGAAPPQQPPVPQQGLAALPAQMPGAQPQLGAPPQQIAQAAPAQGQPRFSPEQATAIRGLLANPQTRATGIALMSGNKLQYQTDADGNIIALDPNGRQPPQVVYKAAVKPMVVAADSGIYDPATKSFIQSPSTANTPDQKNYQAAKAQGYKGDFNTWLTDIKQAGATKVNLPSAEKSYDTKVGGAEGDYFVNTQQAGRDASGQLNTLKTMEKLIDSPDFYSGTGGSKMTTFKRALASIGVKDADTAAPNELFEKLSKQFVLDKAGGSLGSNISNGDRDFIAGTVANVDNTPAGNKAILQLSRRLAERQVTVAKMARDYAKANGGRIDAGFDDQLAKYAEANPITADLPQPAPRAPQSAAGRQAPAAAPGAPVRVQSPDEARRLPKGTPIEFMHPEKGLIRSVVP